jgi:hypothetical protein
VIFHGSDDSSGERIEFPSTKNLGQNGVVRLPGVF